MKRYADRLKPKVRLSKVYQPLYYCSTTEGTDRPCYGFTPRSAYENWRRKNEPKH